MLTIIQSVCRNCQKVYPVMMGGEKCPSCKKELFLVTFVEYTQQSEQANKDKCLCDGEYYQDQWFGMVCCRCQAPKDKP